MSRRRKKREPELVRAASAVAGKPSLDGEPPPLLARHVMRVGLRTVAPGDSLARAASAMEALGTRELAVVEGRALVGILTRTDMEAYRGHFEWTAVRSAMTLDPVTVLPEASIGEIVSVFLARGFNGVPVSAGGELLGMIRRTDVLRALAPAN